MTSTLDIEMATKALLTVPVAHRKEVGCAMRKLIRRDQIRRRGIEAIEAALPDLRLTIACLAHDLEATRRERDDALARLAELEN